MTEQILEALRTGAGMLWKAFCALVFGYLISAAIQVLVTRAQMAKALGERGAKQAALAGFFGFVSSSCSFAALAASRSVLVKGAHPANGLAFLIASTNLVIELGLVLLVLLTWHFFVGNLLLGALMIAYAYLLTRLWLPKRLAERARDHAERQLEEAGEEMGEEMSEGMSWKEKLRSRAGWLAIADAFFTEWKMVWKEILFGFTVAGFISVFVPQEFWNAIFLVDGGGGRAAPEQPSLWVVLENAAVAPVVAFFNLHRVDGKRPARRDALVEERLLRRGDGVSRRGPRGCDGDLDPRQVLRLALRGVPLGGALRLHGRGGHHGAPALLDARHRAGGATAARGDGAVRDRLHLLAQHRVRPHRQPAALGALAGTA